MAELRHEQTSAPLPFPYFRSGDAIQIKMLPYKTSDKPVLNLIVNTLKDVVIPQIVDVMVDDYAGRCSW